MTCSFTLNGKISFTRDKFHSLLCVILLYHCYWNLFQLWLCFRMRAVGHAGHRHRKPRSWDMAQVLSLGKHWKKWYREETGTAELRLLPCSMAWLPQSCREFSQISFTSKKKPKVITGLKSQWLFLSI